MGRVGLVNVDYGPECVSGAPCPSWKPSWCCSQGWWTCCLLHLCGWSLRQASWVTTECWWRARRQDAEGVQMLHPKLSFPVIIINHLGKRCSEHSHTRYLRKADGSAESLRPHFMSTAKPLSWLRCQERLYSDTSQVVYFPAFQFGIWDWFSNRIANISFVAKQVYGNVNDTT